MVAAMNYGQLYAWTEAQLGSAFEAAQLFTHVTAKQVFDLPFVGKQPAIAKEIELLLRLCDRRTKGEPLQYLLGEWEFYGLPFVVGEGVLIPRADTETLVEVALDKLADGTAPNVLDLCSGSGCVAIAISHQRPDAVVTAVELSAQAFSYLEKNIALNHSGVHPVQGDLREYQHPVPLDVVTANPPYIPRGDMAGLQAEVHCEPTLALDGGEDGLDFYRAIAQRYYSQIRPGGWLCLEVGIHQKEDVSHILATNGFHQVDSRDDLSRIPRVVYGRKPPAP